MRFCLSHIYGFSSLLKDFGIVNATIVRNCTVPQFYESGINIVPDSPYTPNNHISSTGAYCSYSGLITQRQSDIRRIVSNQQINWGLKNKSISKQTFTLLQDLAKNYFNTRRKLYIVDGYTGWHQEERMRIRVVCNRAYHALFMTNLLVRPTPKELKEDFANGADYYIFNAGQFHSNKNISEVNNTSAVAIDLEQRKMVILGSQYAGEMKSGLFTIMSYLMLKKGNLPLLGACSQGEDGVSIFLGLPGVGKTTLALDARRRFVADDQVVWGKKGIFNLQGGCHVNVAQLTQERNPSVWSAIRFGTLLENIVMDEQKRVVNYFDTTMTENIRATYPHEYIPNAEIPALTHTDPRNVILMTCDAFSVFPLVSKLTPDQALYHFYSGYSSKKIVTTGGTKDYIPVFSSCYQEDFMPVKPLTYANLFYSKVNNPNINIWLINTGWIGGNSKISKRVNMDVVKRVHDAIHDGSLHTNHQWGTMPIFNLKYAKQVKGVDPALLNQEQAWVVKEDYKDSLTSIAHKFKENMKRLQSNEHMLRGAPQI